MSRIMKIMQCQTGVSENLQDNLKLMEDYVKLAAAKGADLVTFGETFACPYRNDAFPVFAEEEGGYTYSEFSRIARENRILLSAGTVPELSVEMGEVGSEIRKIYNTAYVFNEEGECIAKHRKAHLFDIDIKGGQYFKESDTFSAGDCSTVFDTRFGKIGLLICFDIRFAEFSRRLVLDGAELILMPANFNMTTGPAHWELSLRARALDNQCFMAATGCARDEKASYIAYGHSMITDPWGSVLNQMDEKEGYILTEIDLDRVKQIREQLPILRARRPELY